MKIAIIGAGLAGLTLAQRLQDDHDVEVFEKSRGCGGRMATRRLQSSALDHGAQFFTARSPRFKAFLQPYLKSEVVQPWQPKIITLEVGRRPYKRQWFERHYVAVPGMTALAKELAGCLNVRLNSKIHGILKDGSRWLLKDEGDQQFGPYDWVVCACPAPQARQLLPEEFAGSAQLDAVEILPCHAALLTFPDPPRKGWGAAVSPHGPISWLAWTQHKPGRSQAPALVVLSNNRWSQEHFDDAQEELLEHLPLLAGIDPTQASEIQHHRWRYAKVAKAVGQDFLIDPDLQLAACGDWCLADRVEAAFLSASALADQLTS